MADETKEPQKIKCPCCGELTLTQPLDVKGVTLDEFMASIIAGTPYTHTYKMYSGSVEVTVESLSKQLSNMLFLAKQLLHNYINKLEADENPVNRAGASPIKELAGTMQLFFGVKLISIYKDKTLVKQYMPADVMQEAAAMIIKASTEGQDAFEDTVAKYIERCISPDTLSSLPDGAIKTIVVTHADIYAMMLGAGFDENFWEGIELA